MAKQKIAVLIDWYLPGTRAGGPVRSVFSLLQLLKQQYELYVITSNRDLGSKIPYGEVPPGQLFEKEEIRYFYFPSTSDARTGMIPLLRKISPDLIYLNSFWSYPFSIAVVRALHAGKLDCPVLLAPRGMLGRGALGLKALKKQVFLGVAKLSGMYRKVIFHATQAQEKADVLRIFPSSRVLVAPNINSGAPVQNRTPKQKGKLKAFFLSRIAEVKNLHFALEVLAEIAPHITIEYTIMGNPEDADYVRRCQQAAAGLPSNISVKFAGEVPFSLVQQEAGSHHCLFLPTLNENYGHSIVESLLSGCPVVISDQTPWSDLFQHGAGYALPLKDKEAFASALTELANCDDNEFRVRSEASISYIRNKIDLAGTRSQYLQMFDECLGN